MVWIRTQDRESLVNVEEIILIRAAVCCPVPTLFHIDSKKARLGTYGTEERALQILDNIEHWLTSKHETIVYEMPKE
jgi:hypothetical protein